MDTRQMAAMAEATRLTRQGRLIEATALIQQTLAGRRRHGGRRMRHVPRSRPVARPPAPASRRQRCAPARGHR
jgi:hypothetical protein